MSRELREEMKTVPKYLSVLFCRKINFQGKAYSNGARAMSVKN